MIIWECVICLNLHVDDYETIEALKRFVREIPGIFILIMPYARKRLVRENPGVFYML